MIDAPKVNWSLFDDDDIALIRQAYIDNEEMELHDDTDLAKAWVEVFNPPMLTEERVAETGCKDGPACPTCRVDEDPRTRGMLGLIFDKAVSKGEHPYGYSEEQVKTDVAQEWADEVERLRDEAHIILKEKEHWFIYLQGFPPEGN